MGAGAAGQGGEVMVFTHWQLFVACIVASFVALTLRKYLVERPLRRDRDRWRDAAERRKKGMEWLADELFNRGVCIYNRKACNDNISCNDCWLQAAVDATGGDV